MNTPIPQITLVKTPIPGSPGKVRVTQHYAGYTVTRVASDNGFRAFAITHDATGRRNIVPYDIARIAAGKDVWMRHLSGRCDCGKSFLMHESDVPYCPACQQEAEEENARSDRGE